MRTTHRAPTQKIKIMGLFDGLGSSVIGSFLSGIFGSRQQKRNLEAQQRENSMARQFNAQQAALTRQFNSAEAEKSRQFEERMYQLYESPIAQAQQRQQAGLPMEATSMSVGSSSTASASPASTSPASLPSSPSPWSDLGESVKQLPFIRQQIRAAVLDNQQRELEQEKTRAETFKTWQEGYQTQIENGFTAEEKKAIIANLIADKEKKGSDKKLIDQQIEFIENAKEAGVNPVIDASNESKARTDNLNAQTTTENLLRMPRKAQIEADTIMKQIASEIEDKYGRQLKSLEVQTNSELLRKIKTEVNEYVRSTGYRMRIIHAGATEAEADALISSTAATIESIDANYLEALTGSGDDWYSPLGMLLYALWSKDGIALKFGK